MLCAGNLHPSPGLARLGRAVALSAVVVVASIQTAATVDGMAYQAALVGTDPCFLTSVDMAQDIETEVAQFGQTAGSTAAVVELDDVDSKPMAYLLRANFADVYLPHPVASSQTPKLLGDVGLGSAAPMTPAKHTVADRPAILTATAAAEIRYPNGVVLHNASFSPQSGLNQRVQLAVNWSVESATTSSRPVVWQIALESADGQTVQLDSGDSVIPTNLRGRALVSWFSIDARREVAPGERPPGKYALRIELIDTFSSPPEGLPATDAGGNLAAPPRLPVTLGPLKTCELNSAVP